MAEEITLTVAEATVVTASDYEQLDNLPTLEGTELKGNLTLNDVHAYTQTEVDTLLNGKADTSDIPSLTGYATESYVNTAVEGVTVDAYTKAETNALLADKADASDIPSAVTESTVSGWGFTKNTGTYSKPSGGIPKSDLASAVQTSLGKADTALQSFTEEDPVYSASPASGITTADITAWNNKSDFSGSYNDLSDKPTIPSAITVDEYLSSSSTNPVQNKVINSRINTLASDVDQKWPKANVTTSGNTAGDAYVPTCGAVRNMVFGRGFNNIYASSSTVQAIIAQMGASADVVTPSNLVNVMAFLSYEYACPYNMLCWQNGYTLELARIFASIDLTTQKATAYARGRTSIAYGIIGEDDSWTVTAL